MGYYYARELSPEAFDFEDYFCEDEVVEDKMWIGGNRHFNSINDDLLNKVYNLSEDLTDIDDSVSDEELKTVIEDHSELFVNAYDEKLSFEDCRKLLKLCNLFEHCTYQEDYKIICQILEILYKEPFVFGTFRGCSQGDWIDYICPSSISEERKAYISAILFSTGVEFQVSEEKYETLEDFENNCEDFVNIYSSKYGTEEIKKDIAKQLGYQENEIKLLVISDRQTVVKYTYKEVE